MFWALGSLHFFLEHSFAKEVPFSLDILDPELSVVWPRESNLQPPILQALLLAPLETSNKLHSCAESLVPSSFHYGH